jgi:hypothetical protein
MGQLIYYSADSVGLAYSGYAPVAEWAQNLVDIPVL